MNAMRDFSPSAILSAEKEQFEKAIELTDSGHFVNVNYEDDYYFGSIYMSGVNVLSETFEDVGDEFTVLDVGCGNGVFLREVASRYPLANRIGISAVSCGDLKGAIGIAGDICRTDTWEASNGILPSPKTVDVAVSHLTFMHIANPIKGLANILNLIKPNGRLFIDHIRINTNATDIDAVENALHEAVEDHVKYPRISSKQEYRHWQVKLDFPVFTEGLDSVNLGIFKPYVNEHGEICFTV